MRNTEHSPCLKARQETSGQQILRTGEERQFSGVAVQGLIVDVRLGIGVLLETMSYGSPTLPWKRDIQLCLLHGRKAAFKTLTVA